MPAVLHTGDIETVLPPGLTRLNIQSLTPRTNLDNKYVQATVNYRYPLNTLPVSSLKLVLENSQGDTIELIAVGQAADDLDICVKGDVLVFLKFEVEDCPGHCNRLYQMIADDTEGTSLIWIFKNSKISSQARPGETTSQSRTYSYKPLGELKLNTTVDVYGVVKSCKPPTKSKGSDFCCAIGLTDSSLSLDTWLACNVFSPSEAQLPKVEVGDIIRMHRLKIRTYQGRQQGCSGPGFHWLLFRGSFDNREASSPSYTIEQNDEDKVKSLLQWWLEHGALNSIKISKRLSEVQPHEYFNLICQVIRVCDLEVSQCKVLRVWDGSKFQGVLKMTEEKYFNDTVLEDGTLMEASAGMAVDVYLYGEHILTAGKIKPGNFIQLINLHAAVVSGTVALTLHESTRYHRGVDLLPGNSPQVKHLSTLLTSIVDEVTANQAKAVKRPLISVDTFVINNLTEVNELSLVVDHQEATGEKRMKVSQSVDPLEISSNSDQSLQFSDTDLEVKRSQHDHIRIQDNSISSSDQSLQSSQPPYLEIISDILSKEVSVELINDPEQSSQDSFHTAASQPSADTVEVAVSQACKPEAGPTRRVFLSLKTKPDSQENTDDDHQQLTLSNNDFLSLSSSILCFDTAQFTETCSAVNTQEHGDVTEIEASEESEKQPICKLKTASTVIGHHTIVPESSLRTVLEGGVCKKYKVLVRVQGITPWPVSPGKLVNFICFDCGHMESAESVTVQLNTDLPVHVCSAGVTQCQQLKPVIVLSFILTDGQDSLTAYVWDQYAVQLLCDIQPLQLLSATESFKPVQERLERLCPLGSRLEERPLLECCLFSYGAESNVKYQMFDTVLV